MKNLALTISKTFIFICLIVIIGVPTFICHADRKTVTGNWMDFTMYCGSGVCAPFGTNHKATATVEYYYVSGGFRSVYSQSVSGTLSPGSSPVACGYYRWLFVSPATYSTAEGTITINGWVRTGALCNSNSTCDGYSSTNDYWLRCNGNCTGNFKTASYFSTRCIPTSIGHTLYLGF